MVDRLALGALIATRELTQSRRRALQRRRITPALPMAAERSYERKLTRLVQETQREILSLITPLLPQIAVTDERQDILPPPFEEVFDRLRILFARISQNASPADLARAQADQIDRHVKRQLARLLTISPEFADIGGGAAIDQFIQDNVLLIQNLLFTQITDLRTVLEDATRQGLRVEAIAELVEKKLGTTRSRAVLIARDQTLTLNARIQQERQQNVGITEYIWDTSRDSRVRPDHARLHGTRQSWAAPPITDRRTGARNHPGGDILCRCVAIPVITL